MRILDVDLDFFLDKVALDQSSSGERLSEEEFRPLTKESVREFLEGQCGLSTSRWVPGKFVTRHHEAFYWWRELIKNGKLAKPFEVVHVDAHADLGSGTFGYSKIYVGFDLLHQPLEQRETPVEGATKMNAGNYLLVAIACRWLNKLVYVMHPQNALDDCEEWLFSECGEESWTLSLPKLLKPRIVIPGITLKVLAREPAVEFVPTAGSNFQDNANFDFMVLSQSPGFTPESSDLLVPVIQEYMDLTP